uniref:Uncharacterized protein n=1 Tax=Ciona intestinalis TaxID=7719 RepID=H2Y2B0_CIOIN
MIMYQQSRCDGTKMTLINLRALFCCFMRLVCL